ncbi:hypothetical protein ZWY2020_006860 [Hordeum vulgare]|nr:hypothetical protein ZWY2020_006860 [Hordeum vulgare]
MPPSPSPSSATITKSFCNEVLILSALRHRHLVRLHGFCADLRALLVIYDFVPNRTLSHQLHRRGTAAPPPLPGGHASPWRPRSRRCSSTSTFPYYIRPMTEYLYSSLASGIRKTLFHHVTRFGQSKYIANGV